MKRLFRNALSVLAVMWAATAMAQPEGVAVEIVILPDAAAEPGTSRLVQRMLEAFFWNEPVQLTAGATPPGVEERLEYVRCRTARIAESPSPFGPGTPSAEECPEPPQGASPGTRIMVGEEGWRARITYLLESAAEPTRELPRRLTAAARRELSPSQRLIPRAVLLIGSTEASPHTGVVRLRADEVERVSGSLQETCDLAQQLSGYGVCTWDDQMEQALGPLDVLTLLDRDEQLRIFRGGEAVPFRALDSVAQGVRFQVLPRIRTVLLVPSDDLLPEDGVWVGQPSQAEIGLSADARALIRAGRLSLLVGGKRASLARARVSVDALDKGTHEVVIALVHGGETMDVRRLHLAAYERREWTDTGGEVDQNTGETLPLWVLSRTVEPVVVEEAHEVRFQHIEGRAWLLVLLMLLGMGVGWLVSKLPHAAPPSKVEAIAFERDTSDYRAQSKAVEVVTAEHGAIVDAVPALGPAGARVEDGVLKVDGEGELVIRDRFGVYRTKERRLHRDPVGVWDNGCRYVALRSRDQASERMPILPPTDEEAEAAKERTVAGGSEAAVRAFGLLIAACVGGLLSMLLFESGLVVFGRVVGVAPVMVLMGLLGGLILRRLLSWWAHP